MGAFVLRRLGQAALTVIGVMIVTFLLFRGVAGDIATARLGVRATEAQKAEWRHRYGYDRPLLINIHNRLMFTDHTGGDGRFLVADVDPNTRTIEPLALIPGDPPEDREGKDRKAPKPSRLLLGQYVRGLSRDTSLAELGVDTEGRAKPDKPVRISFVFMDGTSLEVDVSRVRTCGELIDAVNDHPDSAGRVTAGICTWRWRSIFESQFVDHLWKSVTFSGQSLVTNERLTEIIVERAPKSLAITVPSLALGWFVAMIIACFVAYYRGSVIDRAGVFLSVLGMCIPFLAFMIYGQWLMFTIAPRHAFGIFYRGNVYVPILITVIAGLGGSVRFYRTVILDEVHRDYVRTARAKGAPLPSVLFKHVLRNCMLPILTNLILAIPFLMMGNLLVESYFGIPGLGDLLLTSFNNRDEAVLNGLVFLTSVIYTLGLLLTDLSYAVFDPRVRLS